MVAPHAQFADWLHTGDVARLDEDGYIYIVDRQKDMALRGGENIYCAEVESAVFTHPAVAERTAAPARAPASPFAARSAPGLQLALSEKHDRISEVDCTEIAKTHR